MNARFLAISIIASAIGAYVAAKKRRSWTIWGVICFIFPFAIVALAFLPRVLLPEETKTCPHCGTVLSKSETFCTSCKRELPIELVRCSGCDKFVPESEKCPECGSRLGTGPS